MGFKARVQEYRRPILGIVSVIGFFILWELFLTYVVTFNPFFITKPTLMAVAAKKTDHQRRALERSVHQREGLLFRIHRCRVGRYPDRNSHGVEEKGLNVTT